jgi:cobalt-zinc-cadmium efflux system outer membrane protein
VDINAVRVKAGDLAQVELLRSKVAALQFQTAVEQAKLRLTQAKNKLQNLLGRSTADANFEVSGTLRRDAAIPAYNQLLEQAISQRPDLQGLLRWRVRNQADIRLQIAQGKIDYTVGMEYRRQDGINGRGNSLGFFFAVPLPVFNRNQGEIVRAERELDQSAARIRALEQTVKTEMTNAYEQYQTSKNLLEGIEQNMLEQAREVLKITEYSYRRGEASLLEFLDAQRAFNDAMQSYNEARANYARSLYTIDSITAANISKLVMP